MKNKLRGNLMLMATALIWGTAFVAQKSGMDLISPIAFNGIRTLVGAFALIPVIIVMGRDKTKKGWDRTLIAGGICSGLALCASGNIQQIGLYYTSVSHSGFITALYVVIVPLMGLLLNKRITPVMWCCVAYTLQILGQRETEPAIASMILCLESVFALIAGMVLLGEMMSFREIIGCIIMFAAIFVANLPEDAFKHSKN